MIKASLSDLANITMGTSPAGEFCGAEIIGMPLLNGPAEFTDFYPVPAQFTSAPKRLSKPDDILFCVRGSTTGRMNWSDQEYAIGRGLAAISHKSGSEYNHFLRYLLENNLNSLLNNTNGSTFPNLTSDILAGFIFTIPDLGDQKKISAVLKSVDTKIAINNRINNELEAMAKTLYDYWFVQFDFPGANGKPYKTSGGKMVYNPILKREIPEGWSSVPLLKITSVSNQLLNPADYPNQVFRHFSIPVYDATKTFDLEAGITIGSNKFTVKKNDILVSKLNPWFNRVIYAMEEENIICSTELVVWRTSSNNIKNFLYMVATSPQFITYCTQSATGTSNSHKRVNPNIMMRFEIPFDKNIAVALGEKLEPMIKKLVINQRENTELAKLRDWLLPMLMNGQVTVK
ncbi:restriction endonuclease subunit S [Marinospirillum minutulum]|uniref:restriction endonuclease subunit S n=1 Tax=Marinospirillum minutulum TaxID=64974 RepID=UPI0004249FBA|nr:restriction endonuclease subunit S [Marinospirillum minutulum]